MPASCLMVGRAGRSDTRARLKVYPPELGLLAAGDDGLTEQLIVSQGVPP